MKIVTVNLKYSANLGDQLISECLLAELRAFDPALSVDAIDLAGRIRLGQGLRNRVLAMSMLHALPRSLRAFLAGWMLRLIVAVRLRPMWRLALADADAVVIGGGNLLADSDLNFPVKVSAVLQEARRRGLPVGIFAVGVSPGWSAKGRELFGQGLAGASLKFASVRDEGSQQLWHEQLMGYGVEPARLALDPGLLTARHYPVADRPGADASVGVCITSPVALNYHAIGVDISTSIDDWYVGLGNALVRRGYKPIFFTTGSTEDVAYLKRLAPRLRQEGSSYVRVADSPDSPAALVALVARCKLILGHRLHACIPAYSYGIPSIGFMWDPKMVGFFDLIGYPERLVHPSALQPSHVIDRAEEALRAGIDPDRLRRHIERARADVALLTMTMRSAVEGDRNEHSGTAHG